MFVTCMYPPCTQYLYYPRQVGDSCSQQFSRWDWDFIWSLSGQHIKENESPSSFPSILFYPSIYIGGQLGKLIYAHEYTYITAYYSIYLNRILKSDFYDGTQSTVFYFTFFMYKLTSFFILKKSLFMILHYLMVQITQ